MVRLRGESREFFIIAVLYYAVEFVGDWGRFAAEGRRMFYVALCAPMFLCGSITQVLNKT